MGFASLLATSTRILRVFGALAAFGILVAYLVTLGVSRLTRPPAGAADEIDAMRKTVGGAFTRP